jgi:hypothetical protein
MRNTKVPLHYRERIELRERSLQKKSIPAEYIERLLEERDQLAATVEHLQNMLLPADRKACPTCGLFTHVVCFQFKMDPIEPPQETADDPPIKRPSRLSGRKRAKVQKA